MLASSFRRSILATARPISRPAIRTFTKSSFILSAKPSSIPTKQTVSESLEDVDGEASLFGPGGKPNTIPTDFEQATGLERLEYLGKLKGIEIFDDQLLDSSRKGTIEDPIIIDSYDHERYIGCTGSPAGSHTVEWLRPKIDKVARCWECGSVYKLNFIGVEEEHDHHH